LTIQKRSSVIALFEVGAISSQKMPAVLTLLGLKPDKDGCLKIFQMLLLCFGSCAIAFSVIFFIAYNWADMSRLSKFTLLESSIAFSVILYWRLAQTGLTGRLVLLVASLLVGALMAFFGQTYQTGADTWQLFFYWALFITPWVVISQFSTLWLVWLLLLNLSLVLYFDVFHSVFGLFFDSNNSLFWCLFGFNTLVLIIWEMFSQKMVALTERWPQRILAVISGWAITTLVIYAIVEESENVFSSSIIWLVWISLFMWVYRRRRTDLFMLAGGCLSVIVVVITLLAMQIMETGEEGALLFLSVLIIAMGSGATYWLKQVHKEIES
jgi:uncharacterized membrane protein